MDAPTSSCAFEEAGCTLGLDDDEPERLSPAIAQISDRCGGEPAHTGPYEDMRRWPTRGVEHIGRLFEQDRVTAHNVKGHLRIAGPRTVGDDTPAVLLSRSRGGSYAFLIGGAVALDLARIIHEKCTIKAKPLISLTTMRMGCLMKFFAMKFLAQVFGGLGRFRAVR